MAKIVTTNLPIYYQVLNPQAISDSTSTGQLIHSIEPSNNNQAGLNTASPNDIKFTYKGDDKCIRHPFCVFNVKAAFRTRAGNPLANNRNAQITFANNWFWHLFDNYQIKILNANGVENLKNPGVFVDTLSSFKGYEYRNKFGELFGYIPDENNGQAISNPITITNNAIAAGGAVPADFSNVTNNANFNNGFKRRLERYNYNIQNDNTPRYITADFPLAQVSGFASVDKILKHTSFEIILSRKKKDEYRNAFFGVEETDVDFGQSADTGILSINLEIYEQIPALSIDTSLTTIFSNSDKERIPILFRSYSCSSYFMGINERFTITETSYKIPRYIFLIFKGANIPEQAIDANVAYQFEQCNKNYQVNSHANIENIVVSINGQEFPNIKQNSSFLENCFNKFYKQAMSCAKSLRGELSMSMNDFRNSPIFAFDCGYQKPKLSAESTALKIEIKRKAVPDNNNDRNNPRAL